MPTVPGDEFRDDDSIPDDARLVRRIPGGRFRSKNGVPVPDSDNFKNSKNGSGTSVDIEEDDWTQEGCVNGLPEHFGLFSFKAGEARRLGFGVIRVRVDGNPHHAQLQGPKSRQQLKALAAAGQWLKLPSEAAPEDEIDVADPP